LHSPLVNDLEILERSGKEDPGLVQSVIGKTRQLLQVIKLHFII